MGFLKRFQPREDNERGAVTVMVAMLMVVLLGCAAIAVDVGNIYWQRAQLQNGADAAALAIAQNCTKDGLTSCKVSAASTAQSLANGNSHDGVAGVLPPTFPAAGTVTVHTEARNSNGPGIVMSFANIFGVSNVEMGATTTASWGGPLAGTAALPIAFSECQFNLSGTIQVIQIHGGPTCASSSGSGHVVPGGFGWLVSDPGKCGVTITLASPTISCKTGVSEPGQCSATFDSLKNQIVLLPVYDDAGGTGSNGWFHIRGFAAFQLLGFNFPSHSWNNSGTPSCSGSCKGLIGKFVRFVILDQGFSTGGPDLGADIVRLTK